MRDAREMDQERNTRKDKKRWPTKGREKDIEENLDISDCKDK